MEQYFVLFLFCAVLPECIGIPLSNFYPYGSTFGDSALPPSDDGTSDPPVSLSSQPFPFFGTRTTRLYVNNNGHIALDSPYSQHNPLPLPLAEETDVQLIAPYWADVDTSPSNRGTVYYRNASSNATLLERAQRELMMHFVSAMDFRPDFLFIATWDSVSFFGGASSTLRNTFQCVLVSDGTRSYIIFLYADGLIQWTSGSGTESSAALAGYNGDGSYFSVPGSRTPAIIDITMTSNVGVNGVWAFRVDSEERGCNSRNPLTSSPTVGNILGGSVILLAGPCFSQAQDILCTFDGAKEVPGFYYSENLGYCVSPYFEMSGWKDLQVTLWPTDGGMMPTYTGSGRFYTRPLEEVSDVVLATANEGQSNDLLLISGSTLMVRWNLESLFPLNASSLTVDLILSRYQLTEEVNGNRTTQVDTLSRNEANDGEATVTIPTTLLGNEVDPVSIEVVVSQVPQGSANLNGIVNRARLWSRVFFNSVGTSSFSSLCQSWIDRQEPGIGSTILNNVIPCPRTVRQARAPNSGLREDLGVSRLLSNSFFHPGVDACFRQTTFNSDFTYGQQCCYWSNGSLATGSPSGGTVDKVSPEISVWGHLVQDVLPYLYCCRLPQSDCSSYYRYRPSDNGQRYNPPPPACAYGDPHIVTLDGFKYTFNGRGEFILIQATDNRFSFQGRMVQTVNPAALMVQATVFSALAAKEEFSSNVQIQLTEDGQSLEMLVNGELVDFSIVMEQRFTNVTVTDRGNNALSATFSSGVYIAARASNGIISTVLTSLSVAYRGATEGLMGNFNGNRADDLVERGGRMIPLTSSPSTVHTFGLSWIISDADESLFTYRNNQSFSSFHDPDFTATLYPNFTDPALEQEALQVCGNDQFCLFDIAATGRLEIGLGTAQGNLEYETIVNITTPATCSPLCVNGVCVAENTCSCTSGYQGDGCTEPVILPCDVNPCDNGGSCQLQAGSYICSCPQGFSGIRCQNIGPTVLASTTPEPTTPEPTTPEPTTLEPTTPGSTTPESTTPEPTTPEPTTPAPTTPEPTTPGSSGSGMGIMPDCTCQRLIQCSLYGEFVDDSGITVAPSSRDLRCMIGSTDIPAETMAEMAGEGAAMMALGLGSGLGMMVAPASPIFIDNTFNAVTVGPGSFLFLREIGFISRSEGISQCSLLDSSGADSTVLAAFLNLRQLTVVYENALNQYRSEAVNMEQLGQRENLPFQDLAIAQQCALTKIVEALDGQLSQQQYFCRDAGGIDRDTVVTFTVSCA